MKIRIATKGKAVEADVPEESAKRTFNRLAAQLLEIDSQTTPEENPEDQAEPPEETEKRPNKGFGGGGGAHDIQV